MNNILPKIFDKYINNSNNIIDSQYTYIGIKNSDYKYLKKNFGKPNFININEYNTNYTKNVNNINNINKTNIVISLNENSCDKVINIINNNKCNFILKVPKSFEFNKFVKDVQLDHYDIYNQHYEINDQLENDHNYYFIGIKKN